MPIRWSGLLALAYLGFVSLGLPDGVNGVAWPSVRDAFSLRSGALGAVSVALGTGYILSSFFAGRLVGRLGVGGVIAGSSALAAAGMAVHAGAPGWPAFVAGGALVGLGSGAVDAGLNAFAARTFPSKHVTWLHASYSVGATLGPLLMSAAIQRAGSWRLGYAAVLAALAGGFLATRRAWGEPAPSPRSSAGAATGTLRHPLARLQFATFFVYTGLEVLFGQWAYTVLRDFRRLPVDAATGWVTSYFAAIAVGRVAVGFVVGRLGEDRTARGGTWIASIGAAVFAFAPHDALRGAGLALAGLGLSPVYPCLMARTPARLGASLAPHAIGVQVSLATAGAALLPALGGALVEAWSLNAVVLEGLGLSLLLVLLHEAILARERGRREGLP